MSSTSLGDITELLLTCPFSASQSVLYDWIREKLQNGEARAAVLKEVISLQNTLPSFFTKSLESALSGNHLPSAVVPQSGTSTAFQAASSSDRAHIAINTAKGSNYAFVKEVLYEYIAHKERSMNSWTGSKSYAVRWQTICDKLTKLENLYRHKDPFSILPIIRHVRIVTGHLPLPRLVSILSTPSTNPGQAEWILSNYIRKRILVAGRHQTSVELSSALFSVYETSQENEGAFEAFQNARLLSGLEEGSTREGIREVVELKGLKDQGGLEELVWKEKDETEKAIILREGLREWVRLERYRRGGIWWGAGDGAGERAKVGEVLDEFDRFLCISKPVYAHLRPVFQLVREQSELPTALPPHTVIPTFDLHPGGLAGLHLTPSRTSTSSNGPLPSLPNDGEDGVNVVETPSSLNDEPGAQVVYAKLVEATSSLEMEEVLVDFSQQEFEKVLMEGREWGYEDKSRLGRLLTLIEEAMPNARMSESAFFSVRQSSLALDNGSSSQQAESSSSASNNSAFYVNNLTYPSPMTSSPSTPWPPISNPSISVSPSTSRPLPAPPISRSSTSSTSSNSNTNSTSNNNLPPPSPTQLPYHLPSVEEDPFADPPNPADSPFASPAFLSTLRLLREGPVRSSSGIQDLMLDWVQEEQEVGGEFGGMEVAERIAWGLAAFEEELGDPKLGKIFLRIRTIASINAPTPSSTNSNIPSSPRFATSTPSTPLFPPTAQHHRTSSSSSLTRPDPLSATSTTSSGSFPALSPTTSSSLTVPPSSGSTAALPLAPVPSPRHGSNSSSPRPSVDTTRRAGSGTVIGAVAVNRSPVAEEGEGPAPPPYSLTTTL
ncbi:hypothetical protein BDY24DRAFT_401454 [Mrakia frigida]|uniref:uncharacterized protein n=1 Tax=Mrakia frigida TaxID=29902 RepID=UPI003FCBF432